MIRETYKGRDIQITPTREYGIVRMTLNGNDLGTIICTEAQALDGIKENIDRADANPGRYSAKWRAVTTVATAELAA